MKELSINQGIELLNLFKADNDNYTFIEVDSKLIKSSIDLIEKYGAYGLRTLDSIQLATALKYKDIVDFGITSDKILNDLLIKVGVKTL